MKYHSSVETVVWFKEQYVAGSLKIRPPFQRKPVWTAKQKCSLIESMLLGLPVPEVFIQTTTTPSGETAHAVVDGQQRIRAILQFIGLEADPREEEYNKFPLDKLPAQSTWRNRTFAELSDEEKMGFYGYNLAVRYLETDSDNDIRDMFMRLNKYLTPLNPPELRNAIYTGPFARLVERLADDEYWAENRIVTPADIRRMRDLDFTSNLLIGVIHGPQGGSQKIVDDYYAQYEDYDDEFPGERGAKALFKKTLRTIRQVLRDARTTRWRNKTDFYTLFVAVAGLLREGEFSPRKLSALRSALARFEKEINARLADENAEVGERAVRYVRAVEKGANDKKRRANRNEEIRQIIGRYFVQK